MKKIQHKIVMLTTVVILIMSVIWITSSFLHYRTQDQYNDILQRYLAKNEVTRGSNQLIIDLNIYQITPTEENLFQLEESKKQVQEAKSTISKLRNHGNNFTLTNYTNLIDSLLETIDRLVLFIEEKDFEESAKLFQEATRISNYISEMTLTLIDNELRTYDQAYRSMIDKSEATIRLGILVLILITSILLLVSYLLSLNITKPVHQLTKAANELSKGKFDSEIIVKTNDEIEFLAKTFDRMRVNINNLFIETKQKAELERELQDNKILLQESQFRSLQSQINPHFLFNTLNTVSKKAYLEGSEEISDLLVSIADLLRYNLKQIDRSVTLAEEVEILKRYMDIQKARFTERLKLFTDIDESCLQVQIPALTLQPIIENAVIHGVEPKEEGGVIFFQIKAEKNKVIIMIEDNGAGMTDEEINEILAGHYKSEGHSTGIGFTNVVKRLRLFYGSEDVIKIESQLNVGTKVFIEIPKEGWENHAEGTNR